MRSPSVCAVVLNWNGTQDTLECLSSLSKLHDPLKTIVLVDNASDDNPKNRFLEWAVSIYPSKTVTAYDLSAPSPELTHIPHFVFLQNIENAGYASGNNAGIQFALSTNAYDFIWILNNDTEVEPDALIHLLDAMQCRPEAGIAGSTVVYFDAPDRVQCAGGCRYNPWTTVFIPVFADQPLKDVLQSNCTPKMHYIYGAAMFVRTSVFKKCGLLNENFFLFYEEIDFCKRAMKNGFQLMWCRQSIIRHKCGQSIGSRETASDKRTAFANYHENLSALLYARTLHPLIFVCSLSFRFFGKAAVIIWKRKFFLIHPLIDAYRDFFIKRNQKGGYEFRK